MLLNLILATQFWLMSDRYALWDADKISDHTKWVKDLNLQDTPFNGNEVKGKHVLLLVHGYNDTSEEALTTYRLVNGYISSFKDARYSKFYDLVIGYLWPGDDKASKYFDAKRRALKLAKTMRSNLEALSASAAKVDVLAHSMGNRLMFEALNYPSDRKIVHYFYSFAAAVDNESIEINERYYPSTENCEKIFVFYSKRDDVLKWSYSLAEWDKALGYDGIEDLKKLPGNVQLINYTNLIGQHSQYFSALSVYDFIKGQFIASNLEKYHCLKKPVDH